MNTADLYRDHVPQLVSPGSRAAIVIAVVIVHVLLISLPYLKSLRKDPAKENMFKVKLGADEPSHDRNIGKPERTRPSIAEPTIPENKVAPPPEPVVKTPPKKIAPPPEPVVKTPPKKIAPPPEPVVRTPPKKIVKTPPKKVVRKTVTPPPEPTAAVAATKPRTSAADNRRVSASRNAAATKRSGGNNFNSTVPIGTRDTGQRLGKPDHRTPQGGATEADEAYYRRLKIVMEDKWKQPPDSLLGGLRPQATIELEISADGRVLNSRVVKESGNGPMDESVRRLLNVLDRVPVPPGGALKIHVNLVVK